MHISVEYFIPAGENPGFNCLLSPLCLLLLTKHRCVISACHWLPPNEFLTDELVTGGHQRHPLSPPYQPEAGRKTSQPGKRGISFSCSQSRASSCLGGAGGALKELSWGPQRQNQPESSSHGWGCHLDCSPENVT